MTNERGRQWQEVELLTGFPYSMGLSSGKDYTVDFYITKLLCFLGTITIIWDCGSEPQPKHVRFDSRGVMWKRNGC